jgi:virginiamycin B lyase
MNQIGRVTTAGATTEFRFRAGGSARDRHGPDGNIWFTEPWPIGRWRPSGELESSRSRGAEVARRPSRRPGWEFWFTESNANQVARSPGGVVTEFRPLPASNPYGIARGPEGDIWFTEFADKVARLPLSPAAPSPFKVPVGFRGPPLPNLDRK